MKKNAQYVFFILFFCLVIGISAKEVRAQGLIRGTEPGGPRDRINAFCDPAANPRELRGDFIDCPPTPTSGQQQSGQPSPTQTVQNPTPTARVGDPGSLTPVPTGSSSDSNSSSTDEDPCASGKSYTGEYCGWSPRVGGDEQSGSGDGASYELTAAPMVQGLSYTAGAPLALSDIILLLGVLCLTLYVRSKITLSSRSH